MKRIAPKILRKERSTEIMSRQTVIDSEAFRVQQRHGPMFILFVVWMLSIPFYQFSLVATYSLDNLLAPLLCVGAIFLPKINDPLVARLRVRTIMILMGFYFVYIMAGLVPVINDGDQFFGRVWLSIRDTLYLLIPVLYVRDRRTWNITKALMIYIVAVGAITVFLASTGVIHLEQERFEASRVGIEWLQKAIGFFGSYGDMAILYGFTAAVLVSHSRRELCCLLSTRIGKMLVWLVLLLGIAGSQSRNIIMATIVSLIVYWFVRIFYKADVNRRVLLLSLIIPFGITLLSTLLVFSSSFTDTVSQWGGANAYTTAQARLLSYSRALELIVQQPVFGISGSLYAQEYGLIESIHNMWLRVLLHRGVIGFLAILGIFLFAFRCALSSIKYQNFIKDGAVVLAALAALFIAVEFYPGLSDIVRLMLALVVSSVWVAASGRDGYENE